MTRPVARRVLAASLAVLGCCAAAPALAAADDWHSEQPTVAGSPAPSGLGKVYDMRFWAPNRGVLITAGGLWAYDGTGWHQLSTVCGGTGGRIAWAGPLDFWTISDQAVGQSNVDPVQMQRRSLCHFVGGKVVASYAQPIGTAGEYEQMNAAACLAPDDCWFGGELLPSASANRGAFHLHWDGTSLTAYPSPTVRSGSAADPDRPVADLAAHQGSLFESVAIATEPLDGEPSDQPYRLHQIYDGDPPAVVPLLPSAPIDYGGQPPSAVAPLQLSSDGSQLWAVAGTAEQGVAAPVTALRYDGSSFAPLTLRDAGGALVPGTQVAAVAAEPGTDDAWVAYVPFGENTGRPSELARIARIHADGTVDSVTDLPGADDGISRKGQSDRLACPDAGQCWLATINGWLFHLGGDLPRDDAPEMHRLVTFRPQDAATIILPPDTPADDTSGIAPPVISEPPPDTSDVPSDPATRTRARKLVTGLRRRMVHRTTLELTFTLTAKAHVQLLAKRKRTVVARTKRVTLAKGRHTLRLRLNAKHWPTKLDFRVTALNAPSTTRTPAGRRDPSRADDNPDAGEVTIEGVRRPVR
jgi:hypothetical protein